MTLQKTLETLFVRLVFSVAVPAAIIVGCLYVFNSLADLKYLPSSIFAFGVGFFAIYLVFKYWIAPDATHGSPYQRARRYLVIFILNLAINTEIVYLLVTYLNVPILTAQTVAAVVIAYESYYAYLSLLYRSHKKAAFRRPTKLEDEIVYYDDNGEEINA